MKHMKKRMIILCLMLAAALAASACGRGQDNYTPVTRVSVILPHDSDEYWSHIKAGIEEKRGEAEENRISIKILVPQINYSIPQMTEILRKQIAAKVDFIVVQGNEDPEFNEVLSEAQEQGIRIICVDTDKEGLPEHLYVGTDNYEAGLMLGREAVKLTGGKARLAIMSGEEKYLNMQQRYQGVLDAVAEYPEMEIAEVSYDHYDGLTVMRLYYELMNKADTLLFLEGTGGTTVSAAFDGEIGEYRYVIGFDANEGIKKGILDGVVMQDTRQMGSRVIEEIIRFVTEGSYSADEIVTDIWWLTQDNYDEVMNGK